jgi:UDP-3-O-[3-hydroxymyristoyl] glucosamine N-acyltransferase
MAVQLSSILEKFPELLQLQQGPASQLVERVQAVHLATASEMIFISESKHLNDAKRGKSQIWVVQTKLLESLPKPWPQTLISSPNPYLAMAWIGKQFFPLKPGITPVDGIEKHPTAVISKTAKIGKNVRIGPGAVIGDSVELADDVIVGANTVIDPFVKVGERTHLHPLVFIGHSCEIGKDCDIKPHTTIGGEGFGFAHDSKGQHHHITHYGKVIIEDHVHIGSNVQIDRGTFDHSLIGAGAKLDNHSHYGHNIRIGKNTILVGGQLFAGSVSIGSNCVFGGRVSIQGHLDICDNVQLMGLSAVGKSIEKPGQYGGLPIQTVKDELRTRAVLPFLPKMKKQIARILKRLEMEDDE